MSSIGSGLVGGCLVASALAFGADWRGTLEDGSGVAVDPASRRAWHMQGGERVPLWDGTHRLADGSVVIVRDGTVVPSEGMLETWEQPGRRTDALPETSPCYALVERVCGADLRCATSEPCRLANELLDMAKEESLRGPGFQARVSSADQCLEAMDNAFFTPCE